MPAEVQNNIFYQTFSIKICVWTPSVGLYEFPSFVIINCHTLGCLRQQIVIFSPFRRLEISVSAGHLLLEALRRILLLPLWCLLGVPSLWQHQYQFHSLTQEDGLLPICVKSPSSSP